MLSLMKEMEEKIPVMVEKHNALLVRIDEAEAALNAITVALPDTIGVCYDTVDTCSYDRNNPIFIHKTNCPNCGGLLDGDEHIPYVRCGCCGAKIWSEREVS